MRAAPDLQSLCLRHERARRVARPRHHQACGEIERRLHHAREGDGRQFAVRPPVPGVLKPRSRNRNQLPLKGPVMTKSQRLAGLALSAAFIALAAAPASAETLFKIVTVKDDITVGLND